MIRFCKPCSQRGEPLVASLMITRDRPSRTAQSARSSAKLSVDENEPNSRRFKPVSHPLIHGTETAFTSILHHLLSRSTSTTSC